jgi:sec-independent protein translocase protein TatA
VRGCRPSAERIDAHLVHGSAPNTFGTHPKETTVNLGGPELLIVLVVVLVLFGSTKLPKLARSIGEAKKELDAGMREAKQDKPVDTPTA